MPDLVNGLYEHVILTVLAITLGCLIAIPLGIVLTRISVGWVRSLTFNVTNVFQTIPSLALLAMLAPLLGFGMKAAIVALFLYSLMPILKNTYAGFDAIDPDIIQSAKGMGLHSFQRLIQIEFPLAIPYIMSGLRLTTVYIVSWAVLAGLIGGGGLGEIILAALSLNNKPLVIASSIMAMILALVADFCLGKVVELFSKRSQPKTQQI
ncbi:ABC transporter permease [Lentibacillus lipolyticus]|nr:ABC transporter permease [Lentibacillus lipolyticus]